MNILERIDRRILYLVLLLAVAYPLLRPFGLSVKPGPDSKQVFRVIDELPRGSVVMVSFDYDPAAAPELDPMAVALVRLLFSKDLRIITFSQPGWELGAGQADRILRQVAVEKGKEYGTDWVNLGWRAGQSAVILPAMSEDLRRPMNGVDMYGQPLVNLKLMDQIRKLSDLQLIVGIWSGTPGFQEYISFVYEPLKIPLVGGTTAIGLPVAKPYMKAGQLAGILGGMRGAADIEVLADQPGRALTVMDAQSLGLLVILGFLVLGNIGYLVTRWRGGVKG
ncbi:MAG: hypothetical protein HYY09_05685 [Firmicutes bacterium]|nr:hypothetical protein [Bacillota bacterium]